MKRNIAVSREVREKISKAYGVSERTVWNALNLDYPDTEVTTRIRIAARENGGVVMTTIPAGEAIHFADGTMRMDFENGTVLEGNLTTGLVEIRDKRGEVKGRWQNPTITELKAIREVAQSL